MFLSGLGLALFFLWFFTAVLGGYARDFIDMAPLMLIIFSLLAVLTATRSFKVFYHGFRAAILPKAVISKEMRLQAVSLFRLLSKTTGMVSAIGVLICFVNMLMNLDFSDARGVSHLGINMSASFITLIYGLFLIAFVFEPAAYILKKRRGTQR